MSPQRLLPLRVRLLFFAFNAHHNSLRRRRRRVHSSSCWIRRNIVSSQSTTSSRTHARNCCRALLHPQYVSSERRHSHCCCLLRITTGCWFYKNNITPAPPPFWMNLVLIFKITQHTSVCVCWFSCCFEQKARQTDKQIIQICISEFCQRHNWMNSNIVWLWIHVFWNFLPQRRLSIGLLTISC